MTRKILVATAAAALAASSCYAAAQGMSERPTGQGLQSAPSTQNGTDKKGAQSNPAPANRMGQSTQGSERGSMSQNAPKAGKLDENAQSQQHGSSPTTSGQAPSSRESQSGSGAMSPTPRSGAGAQSPAAQSSPGASSPTTSSSQSAKGPSASGSASTSASVNLTTEQKTKIRQTVLTQSSAPRVNSVNFSLNIGTVVPRSVRVVPVPQTIVEIEPAWRGYMYFLVGDQIVIVEPGSLRIVAVVAA